MKKIWNYLKLHWDEDYSLHAYIPTAILLIVLLVINYRFDFEDTYLETLKGFTKLGAYFLFYSVPWFLIVFLPTRTKVVRDSRFYLKAFIALFILSLDSSMPFLRQMLNTFDYRIVYWLYKVSVNGISLFTVALPLYLFYRYQDDRKSGFYGLTPERFDAKPYIIMLLIMLPLIVAATTLPGFLKQYPMYKPSAAHLYFGIGEWVTVLIYELAYGFDFITVELLFRGFFVIGMAALLGRRSVLAMSVIYCLLHFGKPAGEAISSIFGGYILGVIAYETRSIWGGVIVHLGIAWMMEVAAFIAKQQ
jgi:hypothetical protein